MAVFLDTSYLLVLQLAQDQNHGAALAHWHSVAPRLPPLVTTPYIFDETVTFFNSRGYHAKALQLGPNLRHSPSLQLIHVDEALFYAGWQFFERHQGKQYSLTDCISFILMPQLGIGTACTFDHHFTPAGFTQVP
jgi:predicted nucleic acid-binding protein